MCKLNLNNCNRRQKNSLAYLQIYYTCIIILLIYDNLFLNYISLCHILAVVLVFSICQSFFFYIYIYVCDCPSQLTSTSTNLTGQSI